jgi:hypothetical protein
MLSLLRQLYRTESSFNQIVRAHISLKCAIINVSLEGFGYKWSAPIRWEDLIARKSFTIKCAHHDEREAAFRFHASVHTDLNDPVAK